MKWHGNMWSTVGCGTGINFENEIGSDNRNRIWGFWQKWNDRRIKWECRADIVVKLDYVENVSTTCMDNQECVCDKDERCAQTCHELFMGKYGVIIVQIDSHIITSPLLRVDIPSSSKSVQLCAEMARMEMDDKIES